MKLSRKCFALNKIKPDAGFEQLKLVKVKVKLGLGGLEC